MKPIRLLAAHIIQLAKELTAIICIAGLASGNAVWAGPPQQAAPASSDTQAAKLPNDQLDSLVAPIALYPDPMLSNVLMASTYPLEIIQLQQWLAQNKNLKDKALADAVAKQQWDPSVQALAALPDVAKLLSENIKWTTDLGNTFLAQQDDVMAAVQRMRKTAQEKGNLKSNEQQKVEVKTVESKQVIVIQQANPQVVYVPSYNPTVVYGAPVYAYPPIAYPPPGYYAAGMAISFGVGVAMGAMWSGGWCCGCGWGGGGNNIYINNNNNFVNHYNRTNNIQGGNRNNVGNGNRSNWQHNPQHRGGAPYSDRQLANKYGGTARGDTLQSRQNNARQNQARNNARQPGAATRDVADRGGANAGNRGGPSAGTRDVQNRGGANAGDRGNMNANRGGGERVGNRQVPNSPGSNNRNAFGGASSGMSGSSARASSNRGASSFGGGGGRGGGGRRR
jgi:hypothetical protein